MNEESLVDARLRALCMLSGPTIHELRGAANVLALHLQLLTIEPTDDAALARRQKSLAAADDGRRRLFDIAETFVRLTTIPDVAEREFDLGRITADAVALARPLAAQRRVGITLTAATEPCAVHGRRDVVSQALLDLVLALLERSSNGAALEVGVDGAGDRVQVVLRSPAIAGLDPLLLDQIGSTVAWAGGALRTDDGGVYLALPGAAPGVRE